MTVSAQTTFATYTGNGVTTVFAYQFKILDEEDLVVYVAGVAQVLNVNYSVSGVGVDTGGSVTFISGAPAAAAAVSIVREMTVERGTDYQQAGDFASSTVNPDFDRPILLIQDLRTQLGRSIRTPADEVGTLPELPSIAARAGLYMAFGPTGLPVPASGTGADAALRTDLAITTSGFDGSRLVGFRRTEASAIARSVNAKFLEVVSVADFGTNTLPGTTDMTLAIQRAVNAAAALGCPAYLPASMGECKITAPISISSSRSGLVGDGSGASRILTTGNGFTISPGLSFITLRGFSLAAAPRYTVTPNALVGINITGTTASQVYWSRFDDLFIDGFELAIQANGVCQTSFTRVDTEFCHRGLVSLGQTLNNNIVGCWFSGAVGTSTRGIAIGDGVDSNEGWMISDTLVYGHSRNIAAFGSVALKVNNCILDFGTEFGVLLQSSGPIPCTLCSITNNYIAMTGAADSGIFCANSVAAVTGQTGHRIAGNNILVYAASTLTNGILVDGTQDTDHTIDGNTLRATTFDIRISATGVRATVVNNHAYGPGYSFVGGAEPIFENNRGTVIGGTIPNVASAAAVTLPVGPRVYTITGVTNITSIVATGHTSRIVTLIFAGVLTFTDGSNLKLSANFVTSADDTITLFCDGTNWFEISRSAN